MSILAAVALPQFTKALEDYKLNAATRDMATILRKARSDAIFHGKSIQIRFYIQDNSYKIFYNQISNKKDTRYKLPENITYKGGATFLVGSDRNPYCSFNPSGAPNAGGTIILANKLGTKRYIIVNPVAGRIRMSDEPPVNWD